MALPILDVYLHEYTICDICNGSSADLESFIPIVGAAPGGTRPRTAAMTTATPSSLTELDQALAIVSGEYGKPCPAIPGVDRFGELFSLPTTSATSWTRCMI